MSVATALLEELTDADLALLAERLGPHIAAKEPAPREHLMTVAEVAAELHVAVDWVRRHQAKLGAFRLSDGGGRNPIRFRLSDVEKFLAERRLTPPPSGGGSWRDDPDWAAR